LIFFVTGDEIVLKKLKKLMSKIVGNPYIGSFRRVLCGRVNR